MIGKRPLRLLLGGVGLALAILLGVSLTAGAAGPEAPTEETRPLEIRPAAITSTPELLFVPITPCRIVDTRSAGGPITSGQSRSYYVGGSFGFSPQGGKSGGCGIPTGAKAVVATFAAASPTNAGYMRVWPADESEPQATLLVYPESNAAVGGTVKLRSSGAGMTVKGYGGPTHLIIDVSGYYIQQLQAYISSSGTVLDQSGRLVSAIKTGTGTYTLTWDRDISSCSGQASSDLSGYIQSVYTSGSFSYIYVYNNAGAATDYWANVVINC